MIVSLSDKTCVKLKSSVGMPMMITRNYYGSIDCKHNLNLSVSCRRLDVVHKTAPLNTSPHVLYPNETRLMNVWNKTFQVRPSPEPRP